MVSSVTDYPAGLLAPCEPPCLSVYQPTHRSHPANAQDPVRFRNLLKTARLVMPRAQIRCGLDSVPTQDARFMAEVALHPTSW